MNYPDTSEY